MNDISSILADLERFVCVDESSFNLAMARRHARSPIGERAIDFITRNQGINQSLICAMKASGPFASFIFEGPINKDAFVWYVEHILCPELVAGQVVFLDNLSAHHADEVIDLIEDFGCTVQYLPRYSPDLNPIEMLFSKVKALVRAGRWRDLKLLWKSIWDALSSVTPENVAGWLRASYPSASL